MLAHAEVEVAAGLQGGEVPAPLMSELLEPARSALPPWRLGTADARAFSTLPLASRVASLSLAVKTGSAASKPPSSPAIQRSSSAASSGWAVR